LSEILGRLPVDFPVPVVIVQHIAPDFLPSLVKWLDSIAPLHVTVAQPGVQPQPGKVYIAPGHAHLCIDSNRQFQLDQETPSRHVPSGDVLFETVAACYGAKAIGVVLTGMGDDGARGLQAMFNAGAFTIAQDEESSAVFGMPREAAALGATCDVLPLADIPNSLIELTRSKEKHP
jgi:two-component system chemotaxis response regulator CheB